MSCNPTTSWVSSSAITSAFGAALASPTTAFASCADPTTAWGACCGHAPTLTSISPATGAQGATVPVTLTGANFDASSTVAVSGTGITVQSVVVVSSTSITANFVLAATATIASYTVSVSTDDGTSNTVAFAVTSGINAISGLAIWLDATTDADLTMATGVSAWRDHNVNGLVLAQATAGFQPTKVAAVINGLQIIRFDGIDDFMELATWNVELKNGFTIFIVARVPFANTTKYQPLLGGWGNTAIQHEASNDTNVPSRSKLEAFIATNAGLIRATPAGVTATGARLLTLLVNPSTPAITLYKNGTVDGGPTGGFASMTTTVGGAFRLVSDYSGVNWGQFDIGEVLIFSRALTATEQALIEAILMSKWGLP